MKKSKTKTIKKSDKRDNYGNTSFYVEFENGDAGWYTSKSDDQKKFIIGQEAEYIIEQKEGKQGKTYFKITVPQQEGKSFGKPVPEPRIQMISFAMAYSKDLVVAGKVPVADIEKQFDILYNKMISKL